jgi:hypothetical protein
MKNMKKVLALGIVLAAFSTAANAQATATATAAANIVRPISIVKDVDMNFGNIAVDQVNLGTVVLDPAGARTKTGGVTLPTVAGTVTAAQFTVSGTTSYTYTLTLPATAVTLSSGANSMTADTWTASIPTTAGAGTLSSANPGVETFTVGATLHVAATQAAGAYLSGTGFTVTVNYN